VIKLDCNKLPKTTAQVFHHILAKLLYLFRRTQQDIQTAVAFLCTRVNHPDSDDYKKLTHVIQNLRGTQDLTLMIEPGDHPNWWVDSSYAVHPDMRSHSGIIMTLGKGAMYNRSCKQKLNTKSSTEVELVGIDVQWDRCYGHDIFGSARIICTYDNYLPRQQEYHTTCREWKGLQQ